MSMTVGPGLVAFGPAPSASPAVAGFVRVLGSVVATSGTTGTITVGHTMTAGDWVVVGMMKGNNVTANPTVTDSRANGYTGEWEPPPFTVNNRMRGLAWSHVSVPLQAGNTIVVTPHSTITRLRPFMAIALEYKGLVSFDHLAVGPTATKARSLTNTPLQPTDISIAVWWSTFHTGSLTPPPTLPTVKLAAPFTLRDVISYKKTGGSPPLTYGLAMADSGVDSATSVTVTWTPAGYLATWAFTT